MRLDFSRIKEFIIYRNILRRSIESYGTGFDKGKCVSEYYCFFTAVSLIIFFADSVWNGRFVYSRSVPWC